MVRAQNEYTITGILLFSVIVGSIVESVLLFRQYTNVCQYRDFFWLPPTIGSILESMPIKEVCYFCQCWKCSGICARDICGCAIIGTFCFLHFRENLELHANVRAIYGYIPMSRFCYLPSLFQKQINMPYRDFVVYGRCREYFGIRAIIWKVYGCLAR